MIRQLQPLFIIIYYLVPSLIHDDNSCVWDKISIKIILLINNPEKEAFFTVRCESDVSCHMYDTKNVNPIAHFQASKTVFIFMFIQAMNWTEQKD